MNVDYSLYLVADSDPETLGGRDLVKIVQDALEGGTTEDFRSSFCVC